MTDGCVGPRDIRNLHKTRLSQSSLQQHRIMWKLETVGRGPRGSMIYIS